MTKIIVCNNCNTKLDINKLKYAYIYEEKEEGDLFVDNNVGLLCPYCKTRIEEKEIQRQFNSKTVLKLKKKLEYLEVQKEINISLTKIRTTFLLIIAGCLIYLFIIFPYINLYLNLESLPIETKQYWVLLNLGILFLICICSCCLATTSKKMLQN